MKPKLGTLPKQPPRYSIRFNSVHKCYARGASDAFGKLQKRITIPIVTALAHGWEVVDLVTQERLTDEDLYGGYYLDKARAEAGHE